MAAVVAAVATAYLAGMVTVLAQPSRQRANTSVLDEAEDRIAADSARPVSRAELERAAVQGMLSALDDKWSAYYGPTDFTRFQSVLAGRYSGVGVWVRRAPDGRLRLTTVQAGSPADLGGFRVGDELVAVDGRSVVGRPASQVVAALRGDAGTEVVVTVARGAERITRRLRRAALADDDVSAVDVGQGIVRLQVSAFTRGVGRWVRTQVAAARSRRTSGIILDLRDNPGGLLDEAVETASAFLDGGPVVSYGRRGSPRRVLDALGAGDTAIPLVVLVDGGTASAAEVVTGALQDRGRAVIIGSRTFGKGSVQEPTRLSNGSAIELTVGDYFTPSGRSLDGVGLEPDVEIRPGTPEAAIDARAFEVLTGLLADTGAGGRG